MHTLSKRHIQKQQTYNRILKAAHEEFSKKGLIATKTSDIAYSIGVAHGTLFLHFPTREDLLLAVIESFGIQIGKRLQQLLLHQGSLAEVFAAHLSVIQEYESFYTFLVKEGLLLPQRIRTAIIMIQSGIAHYIEQAYNQDIKDNKIRSFPLHSILNTWLGLIHYYLTNGDLFAPNSSVIESHGKELLDTFMKMITTSTKELL